jgi:hypothetical protein
MTAVVVADTSPSLSVMIKQPATLKLTPCYRCDCVQDCNRLRFHSFALLDGPGIFSSGKAGNAIEYFHLRIRDV